MLGMERLPLIGNLFKSREVRYREKYDAAFNRGFHAGMNNELRRERDLRARYEGAEFTPENNPLWQLTDYLSAKAANSFNVRRTLKIRSRYEGANNSYYRGIQDSMVRDLIGSGPRLQMRTGNKAADRQVQHAWHRWAEAIGLPEKLSVMTKGKIGDGEGIGLLVNDKTLRRTIGGRLGVDDAVQLNVIPLESDQMMTPDAGFGNNVWVDGMTLDNLGQPVEYHILRHHPGDLFMGTLNPLVYDRYAPRHVVHLFKKDRAGQVRGVPEITPALELFAMLRRYTKAVIAAAETAADFAAVIKTQMPASANAAPPVPFQQLPIDRNTWLTLPWGADINQLRAEQPATTYEMFVRIILREICRCLGVPLNIALGDSSGYNYSSGRLDHLGYHRAHRIERKLIEANGIEKIFVAFMDEAIHIPGLIPQGINASSQHRWFWDESESIDPVKDAMADSLELENNTETLADLWARKGEDWEEKIAQRAIEIKTLQEAGLVEKDVLPTKGKKTGVKAAAVAHAMADDLENDPALLAALRSRMNGALTGGMSA
jgi:lambda family phage portal protein